VVQVDRNGEWVQGGGEEGEEWRWHTITSPSPSCASSQSGDERGVDEMYMAGLDWEETVGWEEDR
jgi:hypothetical protein